MPNEEVLSRKELKAPDRFQEMAKRAIDWISGHRKNARLAVAGVVAVAAVAAVAITATNSRSEKAGALAFEVLRAAGGEVSAVPLPGLPGPFYATDAERQRAVVEAADHALAEYPASAAGRLALLMKADAQLALGEIDAAVAGYERYLAEAPASGTLRFGALEGIALAKEKAGKLDEAAAAWERAASGAPFVADHADLQRARVLAAAGRGEEARKLLEGFAAKHAGSPLASDAAERLARLGAK